MFFLFAILGLLCDYEVWEFIEFSYYGSLQIFLSEIKF
jgi:hypothetical protein